LDGTRALAAASWAARDWLDAPGLDAGAPADLLVTRTDPRLDPNTLRDPALLLLRGRAWAR
jgi:imidazolonepropionase-like amidohydrolase